MYYYYYLAPVLFLLHGYANYGYASYIQSYFNYGTVADSRGVIIIRPTGRIDDGYSAYWNTG